MKNTTKPLSALLMLWIHFHIPEHTAFAANTNRFLIPFMGHEVPSNAVIYADWDHPQNCPLLLTNLVSNTNLLSLEEQARIRILTLKYQNITTNIPPSGAVFSGLRQRQFLRPLIDTNLIQVASFTFTNKQATDEILFMEGRIMLVQHRDQSGNGYNIALSFDGEMAHYVEYKKNQAHGLMLQFHREETLEDFSRLFRYARFKSGLIEGKWLMWGKSSPWHGSVNGNYQLVSHVDFLSPFDFLLHAKDLPLLEWKTSDPP